MCDKHGENTPEVTHCCFCLHVLAIQVDGPEPAIQHCNASSLALQGCVFTQDINRAIEISDAMETGTVQVMGVRG